jgi:arylsulfatase A-like enzyme
VRDEPFFLFFHTYHVHDPYSPAPPYDTLHDPGYRGPIQAGIRDAGKGQPFAATRRSFWKPVNPERPADVRRVVALYDGAITELDGLLTPLLAALERRRGRVIVVVTSDHGEEFQEHGRWRHEQLYDELLRVPLIVRHPAVAAGRRLSSRVSLIDLAPTILDMLGLPALAGAQGRSLVPVILGREPEREIFAELPGRGMALIRGSKKIIRSGRDFVFDLESDPGERRALGPEARAAGVLAERLEEIDRENALRRASAGRGPAPESTLDQRTLEQLRHLGYVE